MVFSGGGRTFFSEVVSWLAAATCLVVCFFYFNEVKAGVALMLGLPGAEVATAEVKASGEVAQAQAATTRSPFRVEIRAGQGGHFTTTADINGRPIDVMVDTGASLVALTYEDAERAGVFVSDVDFRHAVSTANGIARIALVTLDEVSIGSVTVHDVEAAVTERGKMRTTLLGMSFLGRLGRTEMRQGTLVLED